MHATGNFDFNFVRAIEVFAAVVETRHFTRAAEMLGMTQSAVSQHLKNLETSVGTVLINRGVRPIELTKAGVAMHRRAVVILGEVEQLRVEVRRAEAAPLPLLRIAMLASIATTLSPPLANLARDRYSVPEVSLFAGLSSDHHNLLRTRRADLAITSDTLVDIEGLIRFPILTEKYLLITPAGYSGQVDDLESLGRELPLVRFSRDTIVGQQVDAHLSRVRLDLPRVLEGDRASIVLGTVAAGMGFTLLTPTLLIDGVMEDMKIAVHPLPIVSFSREIMLVGRERELGGLPEVFAQACRATLVDTIEAQLPALPTGSYTVHT
ncbi:MAG: LysR family transcriptional regulator [Pseudomonadota bacterium]